MSAYIVSEKTITAICEGLRRYNIGIRNPKGRQYPREDFIDPSDEHDGYFKWIAAMSEDDIRSPRTEFDKCGQALVDMNYMSVNARYREESEPHKFKPTYDMTRYDDGPLKGSSFRKEYNPAQMLGAIRCYEYQSCECEEYHRSGIPAALKTLAYSLATDMAKKLYGDNDGMGYYDID